MSPQIFRFLVCISFSREFLISAPLPAKSANVSNAGTSPQNIHDVNVKSSESVRFVAGFYVNFLSDKGRRRMCMCRTQTWHSARCNGLWRQATGHFQTKTLRRHRGHAVRVGGLVLLKMFADERTTFEVWRSGCETIMRKFVTDFWSITHMCCLFILIFSHS